MSLVIILFQFFYAQHVLDINTSIISSLRLFYCIATLVVCSCFDVCWSFVVAGLGWYPCSRLKHKLVSYSSTITMMHGPIYIRFTTFIVRYILKVKVQFTLEQATRAQKGGRRGIALLFLNLDARWGWVVNAMPRPLYPRKRPGNHCTGGWVGPRAGLYGCGKSRHRRDSILGPSKCYIIYVKFSACFVSYKGHPQIRQGTEMHKGGQYQTETGIFLTTQLYSNYPD